MEKLFITVLFLFLILVNLAKIVAYNYAPITYCNWFAIGIIVILYIAFITGYADKIIDRWLDAK